MKYEAAASASRQSQTDPPLSGTFIVLCGLAFTLIVIGSVPPVIMVRLRAGDVVIGYRPSHCQWT
jgi:hypothetical protein